MEDYDKFVQVCLHQLRKNEEEEQKHSRALSASSFIRFYGRPILPPLLSGEQREEMRRHREEIQKATVHKKFTDDPRMAYVQTILQSVQLRKTPTLEELLEESETKNEFLHPRNINKVSRGDAFVGTMDSLSPSSGVFLPPKTSTSCSAFFPSNASPQQSYLEGCLSDQHDSQQESQPSSFSGESQPSPSSGYVTYENPENIISMSEWVESGSERRGFSSSEEIDNMGGFFLHNTSNTIAKMPDIISHPPIDGEELERGGLESVFLRVKDIYGSSFHSDSVTRDPRNAEQFEISHLENVEHEENIPSTTKPDPFDHVNMEKNEELVTLPDKTGFSDNPDLSQTLIITHCLTPEPQKNPSEAEPEPVDAQINKSSTKQSEELHPMSLQALLKKSQEYRRRQRLLKNQAKNTKIQEKTQEQPKAQTEEQSLSDKENEDKGSRTAEDKKTKEQRVSFVPSVEKNTIESEEASGGKTNGKNESENTAEPMSVEEETTLKNKLNTFQEFITQTRQSSSLIQQRPTSAERSQDTFNRIPCLRGSQKRVGKYCTVPVPHFCLSPVRCKSKNGPKDELMMGETKTWTENSGLNEVKVVPSAMKLSIGDNVTSVFAKSSLQIDQLESSLSSLKALISDLESTVKGNLDNQTESNVQSESGFNGGKQSEPVENDQLGQRGSFGCLEEKQGDDDDDDDDDDDGRESQTRQPSINFKNICEDLESEPGFIGVDGVRLMAQEEAPEIVKSSQEKLCKTAATESDKGKEECAKGLIRSDASTRQQFPAKCLTSVAQRMLVPDIFRNVPSENALPCDASVLSDQSDRPELKETEVTAEGRRCVRSPSLNQSYDVEMPSGLWLLEGSGSDPGSQSHLSREKYLTPESGGEEQGGGSKVKRRLLMHVTEGSANTSGAAASVVRLNSSTPRGVPRDKREQLKRAHAAQVRALQDKHRKQQEELLQVLAARYSLLQNVSPRSMSASRPEDTLTFSTLSQPPGPLSQHCRPLLTAAVKGFLTRRLLRTERVAQLVRTVRDSQQFLQALQPQDAARGEFCSRQDVLLQERVALQLRAARYEVYDVFFSLSAGERMQLISWDRELTKDRQLRRQSGQSGRPRRKSFLSAATQKSLERKREMMIQKKAAERHEGVTTKTGQKSGSTAKKPQETKRGEFKANPQRVPKSSCSSRPR